MSEQEVEIVDVMKIPSAKPDRAGKFDYVFTVRLPNGRIQFLTVPEEEINLKDEELTKKVISSYLKEQLGEMLKWVGKKLKI